LNIHELRKQQYEHHRNYSASIDIDDWKRNFYTFIKIRLYMEVSAVLVYFLLKTKIRPNSITMVYILGGIFGGILLAIPMNTTIYIAIFYFFFLKSIVDSCDGHIARVTNQVSIRGDILDSYGSHLNSLGFWTGLGFYLAHSSGLIIFYYLLPPLLIFYAADMYSYSGLQIVQHFSMGSKELLSVATSGGSDVKRSPFRLIRAITYGFEHLANFLRDSFIDDRARTVDLVCLLIIIELNSEISLSWIIFLLFFIKKFILFIFSIYAIVNKNWAEQIIQKIWNNSV
jgi:hypothetical protein